jgi:hypothetical protein
LTDQNESSSLFNTQDYKAATKIQAAVRSRIVLNETIKRAKQKIAPIII